MCSQAFDDAVFVRYPNGVTTHVRCAQNKFVCPVTGKLFSASQGSVVSLSDYNGDTDR